MEQNNWVETSSGNRIHKSCSIKGSSHILINGNTTISENCTLSIVNPENDKDRNTILIGKFCFLESSVVVEPLSSYSGKESSYSIKIGNYNILGGSTQVHSLAIGSKCLIGRSCVLEKQSVIHDCCLIEDGVVIPAGYVIPPFSHVKKSRNGEENQRVGLVIERLPESYESVIECMAKSSNVLGYVDRSSLL